MKKNAPFILIVSNREIYCHQFIHLLYTYFNTSSNVQYLFKQNNYIENKFVSNRKINEENNLGFYIEHLKSSDHFYGLLLDIDSYNTLDDSTLSSSITYFIYDNKIEDVSKTLKSNKQVVSIPYHDLILDGYSIIKKSISESALDKYLIESNAINKLNTLVCPFILNKHLSKLKNNNSSSSKSITFVLDNDYLPELLFVDLYFSLFLKIIDRNSSIQIIDKKNLLNPYSNVIKKYFDGMLHIQKEFDTEKNNKQLTINKFNGFNNLLQLAIESRLNNITWNSTFESEMFIQIIPDDFIVEINKIKKQTDIKEMENNNSSNDEILKYKWLFEIKNNTVLAKQNHILETKLAKYENSLMAKVKRKIKHYLNMLFRENANFTQSLKRILDLGRFVLTKNGFMLLRKIVANVIRRVFFKVEFRPYEFKYLTDLDKRFFASYHDMRVYLNFQMRLMPRNYNLKNDIKFSIVMPVYNPPIRLFKEAIHSIESQIYTNWELCIADDASKNDTKELIKRTIVVDEKHKIHYRDTNGHISRSTNDALALATGDYIVFMDQDDLITADCLLELAKYINENPDCDVVYSDEDKLREDSIFVDPHYKADWSPDNLMSRNYFGHVVAMKRSLVESIGGFRIGYEGSQDYDLILRATEKAKKIGHIAKVLYHWRIHSLSAANSEEAKPYAYLAAKKALEDALERKNLKGSIEYLYGFRGYRINYLVEKEELVSIIIPTKNQVNFVRGAISSIFEKTTYQNFEVILLDNNSDDAEFFEYVKKCESLYGDKFRYLKAAIPFNFSRLMNIGNEASKGKYLCLLNNDTEIIHGDWLYKMVAHAQLKHVGAVGAKLLYPDNTIQHAGVIVGLGGIAGHAFMGQDKDDPGYFNYIQTVNNFSAVTAACLMCRKEVYDEVQGFDETFEVEFNDVDFCLKIIEKGYYNLYVPEVELYHYESVSRGHPLQNSVSYKRHIKEMNQFKKKWDKYIKNDPWYNTNLNTGVNNFAINTFIKENEEVLNETESK